MRRSLLAGSAILISSQAWAGTPLYVCTHAGCARDAAAAIAAENAASTAAANALSAANSAAGSISSLAATVLGYGSTITSLSSSFTTLLNEVTGFSGTLATLSAGLTSNGASLSMLSAGLASETTRAEAAEAASATAAANAASSAGSASATATSALSTANSASGSVAAASTAAASAAASVTTLGSTVIGHTASIGTLTAGLASETTRAEAAESANATAAASAASSLTTLSGSVTSNTNSISSLGTTVTSNTGSIGTLSAGLTTETTRAIAAEATKPTVNPLTGRTTLAQAPVDYQQRAPLPTDDGQNLPTSTGPCVVGGYWAWTGTDGVFRVASDDSCIAGQAVHTYHPNPGFVLDVLKNEGITALGYGTFRMARTAANMGHWTDGGSTFVGTLVSAAGSASASLTFNASVAATLSAGQTIQGPSIPLADSIASVSGSIVTLAAATTGTLAAGAQTFTVFNGGTISLLSGPPYTADYAALDAATQNTPIQCQAYPDLPSGGYCPTQVYVDTLYEQSGSGLNSEPTYGLLYAIGTSSITGTQKNNDTVELGTITGTNGTSVWGAELNVRVSSGGTLTPTSIAGGATSTFDKMGEYAVPGVGNGSVSTAQTQTSVTCGTAGCETALVLSAGSYLQAPVWDTENDVGGLRGVILNSVPQQIVNQLTLNKLIYIPGVSNSTSYTVIMVMRHGADDQGSGAGLYEFPSTGKIVYDTQKTLSNNNPDYINETGSGGAFACPLSVKDSASILMVAQQASNSATCAVDNAIVSASVSGTFLASTGINIGGGQGVNSYGREVLAGVVLVPTTALTAAQWSPAQLSLIYAAHIPPEQSASIVCVACDSRMTTNGDLGYAEHAPNMLARYLPRLTSIYNSGVSGENMCASITGSATIGTGLGNMANRMQGKYDPSLQWLGFILEDAGTDIAAGTSPAVLEQCYIAEVNGLRSGYPVAGGPPHITIFAGEAGCSSFASANFSTNIPPNNQFLTWLYQFGFVPQAQGGLGLTPGWDMISNAPLNAVVSPGLTLSNTATVNVTTAVLSGSNTLTFSPAVAAGFSVGETVNESAIPAGTTLTAVNTTTGVVTLSASTTGTVGTGNNVAVYQPESAGSTQVVLASISAGASLSVGEPVYTDVPANTTITAIAGNTLTLSAGITSNLGINATLTFGDYVSSNGTVTQVNLSGTLLCGTGASAEAQSNFPGPYTYDALHPSHALDQYYAGVWGQEEGQLMQRY